MDRNRRSRAPLLLGLAVLIALALSPAAADAGPRTLRCELIELDPPGPVGDELLIRGNDNAQVRRDGEAILVGTSAGNGPRGFEAISCGDEVTATSVDRIVYEGTPTPPRVEHQFLLDEREGPIGPGASPEAVDPEIEVEVVLPDQAGARPRVQLLAGDGRDEARVGGGALRVAISLEPRPGAEDPDPDLIVAAPPRTVELKLHGGGGDDVLDGRVVERRRGLVRSLLLAGDEGKDALLGSDRGDNLEGGSGPDRLFGRGGRDFLYPSAGRDLVVGGGGADFITGQRGSAERDTEPDVYLGGAGDDYISALLGGADSVSCGAGLDEAAADREDAVRGGNCERLRGPAAQRARASARRQLAAYLGFEAGVDAGGGRS